MNAEYVLEPLNSTHDRTTFSCGVDSLDAYLQQQASQDMRRHLAGVFVLRKANDPAVVGYFTLSALSISLTALPEASTQHIGRYQQVPATLLGRLAVDEHYQGQQLGRRMLLNALQRSYHNVIGSALMIVDALDERAADFYRHFGFLSLPHQSLRLVITMAAIKKVLGRETPSTVL
jgi:ribosomal protein S18 acetylase RimI-like enzyme